MRSVSDDRAIGSVPSWFVRAVTVGNITLVSFGAIGLAAATFGQFRLALVAPLAAVVAVVLVRLDLPASNHQPRGSARPSDTAFAIATLAFIGLTTGYGVLHHAEHIEINRDPGFYTNTAKWLLDEGSLVVDADTGPFEHDETLTFSEQGLPSPEPGTLHFQGNHLLPVLMAEAGWFGDSALFAAPVLLGALALASLYVVAAQRSSALPAFAVTVGVGGSLLWVAFARDAYTEVPSLSLVLFALSRLPWRDIPTRGAAVHIGLALGALCALRIDAPLLLLFWPIAIGAWWINDRVAARRATTALVAGFVPVFAIAMIDLFVRSPEYLDDLAPRTAALWVALSITVGVIALCAGTRRGRDLTSTLTMRWSAARRARSASAFAFTALALGLWFVRPRIETVRGPAQVSVEQLQQRLGITVDATLKYTEDSFAWQSWYLGPLLVALAIGGFALAIASPAVGRRLVAVVGCAAPASMLYLYRPNIFPDHSWVMRRYLTTLTPALAVAAAVALDALLRQRRSSSRFQTLFVIMLAAALATIPVVRAAPVRAAADQRGYVRAIRDTCDIVGPDAAVVVVLDPDDRLYQRIPQAIRGWCGVPVAIATPSFDRQHRIDLTEAWRRDGVALYLIGSDVADLESFCRGPSGTRVRAENPFLLEQTLTVRPARYSPQSLEFEVFDARGCG